VHEASLHEEIVRVASDLFERSGRVGGRDLENWLEAERIVVARCLRQKNIKAQTPAGKMASTAKDSNPKKAKEKKNRQSSGKNI
jgi:Protein of unknown function (DUF2934)